MSKINKCQVQKFKEYEKNIFIVIDGENYSQFKGKDWKLPEGIQINSVVSFDWKQNGEYKNITGEIIVHDGVVATAPSSDVSQQCAGRGSSFNPSLSARQTALDKAIKFYEGRTLPIEDILKVAGIFEDWLVR